MYYRDVAFSGDRRLQKKGDTSPNFLGGRFSKLYQVTPQTQLSRPITLGHYTSWSADSAGKKESVGCDNGSGQIIMETLLHRHNEQ